MVAAQQLLFNRAGLPHFWEGFYTRYLHHLLALFRPLLLPSNLFHLGNYAFRSGDCNLALTVTTLTALTALTVIAGTTLDGLAGDRAGAGASAGDGAGAGAGVGDAVLSGGSYSSSVGRTPSLSFLYRSSMSN